MEAELCLHNGSTWAAFKLLHGTTLMSGVRPKQVERPNDKTPHYNYQHSATLICDIWKQDMKGDKSK